MKAEDDTLVTINQVHPIYVAFSVPEQQLPAIRRRMGESALSVVAELPGETARPQGTLTFIDNAVDATTGTIQLKATFTNTDNVLWPGQFVRTVLKLNVLTNARWFPPGRAIEPERRFRFRGRSRCPRGETPRNNRRFQRGLAGHSNRSEARRNGGHRRPDAAGGGSAGEIPGADQWGGDGQRGKRAVMKRVKTSKHPTSNIRTSKGFEFGAVIGCWMLDVGCWMFLLLPRL